MRSLHGAGRLSRKKVNNPRIATIVDNHMGRFFQELARQRRLLRFKFERFLWHFCVMAEVHCEAAVAAG